MTDNESVIIIEFVTCPTMPEFRGGYDRLIEILNNGKDGGSGTPDILSHQMYLLHHGRISHRFRLRILDPMAFKGIRNEIYDILDKITLYPLSFNYNVYLQPDQILGLGEDGMENQTKALRLYLEDYLKFKYGYDFAIQMTRFRNPDNEYITFMPYITNLNDAYDQLLYLLPDDPSWALNLKDLLSYFSVGSDPLILYLLRNSNSVDNLDRVNGVYILPFPPDLNSIGISIEEIRLGYPEEVSALKAQGYKAIRYRDNDDRMTCKNLCSLAGIPLVYEAEEFIFVYVSDKLQTLLNQTVENFIEDNLNRIILGEIPLITITGSWQSYLDVSIDDYEALVKIKFIILKIIAGNPIMKQYLDQVTVFDNLTIRLPFTSMLEIRDLKAVFEREINKIGMVTALAVNTLTEGLIYRWILWKLDPEAMSLILDSGGQLFVISDIKQDKVPSIEKLRSGPEGPKSQEEEIRKMLLEHLKRLCGSDVDPVYLTKFDDMSLQELSTLIRPEKESPYCYTAQTIANLPQKISPLTRKPLRPWVLKVMNEPTLMLRGFLPLGTLKGLISFEDLQDTNIMPVTGTLVRHDLTDQQGQTTLVQIKLSDRFLDLLEIDTLLLGEDFQSLEKLWNRGYFLNVWGRLTNQYLKKLDSHFLKFDPMMYLGKGTASQVAEVLDRIRFL